MILFLLPRSLQEKFKNRKPLVWLMDLAMLWFIVAAAFIVAFRIFEKAAWGEAAWQFWQTATTIGYGNAPAQTNLGRWDVVIFGTIGLAILSSIIAAVFEVFNDKKIRKRIGLLKNPFKDAYVVFNLPEPTLFKMFVSELRFVQKDIPICIVDNRIEELPSSIAALPDIHFVRGSMLDQNTYIQAAIRENKTVIVFPLDDDNPDSDGTTKTIIDCIEEFLDGDTRILYVLVSEANNWMFNGVKKATAIHESMGILALVQECQDPHTAITVQTLLSNKEGANPATVTPNLITGWTWGDLQDRITRTSRRLNTKANLFALIRNGKPELCPDFEEQIRETDLLSIISYPGFNWKVFERALLEDAAAPAFGVEAKV